MEISDSYKVLIEEEVDALKYNSRFMDTKKYMQHGDTSIYEHSISVALLSCSIAETLNIKVNYKNMIRGALLHDYFLYDWHDKNNGVSLHGFTHPKAAWKNASKDFNLNKTEENIILRHMFPLVPLPPKYAESWIVCIADKISAASETVAPVKQSFKSSISFCNKLIMLAKNLVIS